MKNRNTGVLQTVFFVLILSLAGCGGQQTDVDGGKDGSTCDGGAQGGAIDLVQYARLKASDTRLRNGVTWFREDQDSIFAVRDDNPETSWKAPIGKKAVITVDVQPWLRRAVRLDSISLEYVTKSPDKTSVTLFEGCGGTALATIEWADTGNPLPLEKLMAGCIEISITASSEFNLDAMHVITTDPDLINPAPDSSILPPAKAIHTNSGIIEGYYGVPWSWRERMHLIELLPALGLDSYMYAPKEDPLHRSLWRNPYPAGMMERFEELAGVANLRSVALYFGISPFLDWDFSSDTDYEKLKSKLMSFVGIGFTAFALLADDIEFTSSTPIDGKLGSQHAAIANRLLADLMAATSGARLWFVPAVYSSSHVSSEDRVDYLKAMSSLDPSIQLLWTGKGVFDPTLTPDDLEIVATPTGRKPLIWDNYWANDQGYEFVEHIFLSPYGGRTSDLRDAISGIAINPMVEGALNRLDLAQLSHYMDTGVSPDPAGMREKAAGFERAFLLPAQPFKAGACPPPAPAPTTDIEKNLIETSMKILNGSGVRPTRYDEMDAAVDAVMLSLDSGTGIYETAPRLLELFSEMYALGDLVVSSRLDPDITDELFTPLEKIHNDGGEGIWTLAMLGEKLSGGAGEDERKRAAKYAGSSEKSRFSYKNEAVAGLYEAVVSYSGTPPYSFSPPKVISGTPPSCITAKPLEWKPFDGGSAAIYGLPGATVEGPAVRWTPGHSGTYFGVVTAWSATGWAILEFSLLCSP